MVEMTAQVKNANGIHCRPSAVIIGRAQEYSGKIVVIGEKGQIELTSILELMSLELFEGSVIKIQVSGPDEEQVCKEMVELFECHFDFPPQ
jgi:phosphotransferase system HPr (HPr) family protein